MKHLPRRVILILKPVVEDKKPEVDKKETVKEAYDGLVVLMVGDRQSGKTCVVNRLFHNKFDDDYTKTEQINVTSKLIILDNRKVKITVIDTPGLDAGEDYVTDHIDKVNVVLCIYDSTGINLT
jgi:small GTP-binding protein